MDHSGATEAVTWRQQKVSKFQWSAGNALIVDAAAEPSFRTKATAAGLDFISLFAGKNADLFADEAPYLVVLGDDSDPGPARAYAVDLITRKVAIGVESRVDPQKLRLHFRKWTSVSIPVTQETDVTATSERRKVHFRFYDPKILTAFLLTLSPAEAAGFYGPVDAFLMFDYQEVKRFARTQAALDLPAPKLGVGELYLVTPVQMDKMSEVAADTFREDLFGFFREDFARETMDISDAELRQRIDNGFEIANRIGDTRRGSTLNMVYLAIFRPDIPANPEIWAWATSAENPKQHAGRLFIAFLEQAFKTSEEERRFTLRLGEFWRRGS